MPPEPATTPAVPLLLRALARSRAPLRVSLAGGHPLPGDLLPESVEERVCALVLRLPPGDTMPDPGTPIRLDAALDGAPIAFAGRLKAINRHGEMTLEALELLHHHERRAQTRFPTPTTGAEEPRAVLHSSAEVFLCRVDNLSREGIGLRLLVAGARPPENEGPLLCEILREPLHLRVSLELRWQQLRDGTTHCGGRFLAADAPTQEGISRLVADFERAWLRARC